MAAPGRRDGDRRLSPAAPLAAAALRVLLQHQHHLPVLLQAHGVGLHVLEGEGGRGKAPSFGERPKNHVGTRRTALPYKPHGSAHPTASGGCPGWGAGAVPGTGTPPDPLPTLRMWLKSCLSTRKKWQLSSRRMMLAARGASFTSASCPKSSPSCRVATKPCGGTGMG